MEPNTEEPLVLGGPVKKPRKLRDCKYGERMPNGKCPPRPKDWIPTPGNSASPVEPVLEPVYEQESAVEPVLEPVYEPESIKVKTPTPTPTPIKVKTPSDDLSSSSSQKKKTSPPSPPKKTRKKRAKKPAAPAPAPAPVEMVAPSTKKYNNTICTDDMTFAECEMAILRQSVIENEEKVKKDTAISEETKQMIDILEDFLKKRKCVCYGGTAINNLLPEKAQFYDRDFDMADYDFYSNQPIEDAKELADMYYLAGFREVEAKSGVHEGTYKVFVNFTPIADITYLDDRLYQNIQKTSIVKDGIHYASPDFLRMSMYLELSRPRGDVSRWEKVFKRIILLNTYYPLRPKIDCDKIDFQRKMEETDVDKNTQIFNIVRDTFIEEKVVFFGGYAFSIYSDFFSKQRKKRVSRSQPDFDVLSENPQATAEKVASKLAKAGFKDVKIKFHEEIGELIPKNYQISVGNDTIAFVYKPIACHSYNEIQVEGHKLYIATINTILSFYLAFLYVNKWYYNEERILCMSQYLFDIEQENRLEQTGVLKRFTVDCLGKQKTLNDIFVIKNQKYKEFGRVYNRTAAQQAEFDKFFFKYVPSQNPRHVAIMHQKKHAPTKNKSKYVVTGENKDSSESDESVHSVYKPPPPQQQRQGQGQGQGQRQGQGQGPKGQQQRPYQQGQQQGQRRPSPPGGKQTRKKKEAPKQQGFFENISKIF